MTRTQLGKLLDEYADLEIQRQPRPPRARGGTWLPSRMSAKAVARQAKIRETILALADEPEGDRG